MEEGARETHILSPEEILPLEVWVAVLRFLDRKGLARTYAACSSFRDLIENHSSLKRFLTLPFFSTQSSHVDVELSGAPPFIAGYRLQPTTGDTCAITFIEPLNQMPEIVHFKISKPGREFCVVVSLDCFTATNRSRPASYYRNGELFTYGNYADTENEYTMVASYTEGSIVSVQVGTVPDRRIPFRQWIDAPSPFTRRIGRSNAIPYCAFFHNGEMVHKPMLFSDAAWPLYIGVMLGPLTTVEVVDITAHGIKFSPLRT